MIESIIIQRAKETVQILYKNGVVITFYGWQLILVAALSAAFTLTVYFLMGFGLRRMALNRNLKYPWMGFYPVCADLLYRRNRGGIPLLRQEGKKRRLIAMIITAALFVVEGFYRVVSYYPILVMFSRGEAITLTVTESGNLAVPWQWNDVVNVMYNIAYYLKYFLDLALLFVNIMLYMDLFKKYSPARYFLFALLTVLLPIGGIFVFALRNKPAINFSDYIKERYMRMQGTFTGPRPTPPDNPFREFGERGDNDPGDPFAEFGQEKKHEDNEDNDDDPFGGFGGGSDGDGN